jgi:hypothetical protein
MSTFTWSYSRLRNFETCPKRHYHYDIAKDVKEADNQYQSDGLDAHKAYEMRLRSGKRLPLPLTHHESILSKLEALPGENYPEQKLALTEHFAPTGFFADDVWFRTVLDFCNVSPDGVAAAVLDYKTGKPNTDLTQLQLMSVTIMHYEPMIQTVHAGLLFMNHKRTERATFTRDEIPGIWSSILPRVRKLRQAIEQQEYPPRPSGLCVRYCAVVSCPFHGRGTHA